LHSRGSMPAGSYLAAPRRARGGEFFPKVPAGWDRERLRVRIRLARSACPFPAARIPGEAGLKSGQGTEKPTRVAYSRCLPRIQIKGPLFDDNG
jgi:hypothetical protein